MDLKPCGLSLDNFDVQISSLLFYDNRGIDLFISKRRVSSIDHIPEQEYAKGFVADLSYRDFLWIT